MTTDTYTAAERRLLAIAWRDGGCQILGLQLGKLRSHFTVKQYGEAVRAAREELGDATDYSTAPAGQGAQEVLS